MAVKIAGRTRWLWWAVERRERRMKRYKSARHVQRFLSVHDQVNNLFHLRRDHRPAADHRAARAAAFEAWAEIAAA